MYGKNTREKTIEKTLNYLIKEGYLHTDKDGDIKIIKKISMYNPFKLCYNNNS